MTLLLIGGFRKVISGYLFYHFLCKLNYIFYGFSWFFILTIAHLSFRLYDFTFCQPVVLILFTFSTKNLFIFDYQPDFSSSSYENFVFEVVGFNLSVLSEIDFQ